MSHRGTPATDTICGVIKNTARLPSRARYRNATRCHHAPHKWTRIRHTPRVKSKGKLQNRNVDVTMHNMCHTRGPSMAPSAAPPRKNTPRVTTEGTRHIRGNASASYPRENSASQPRGFPSTNGN
jgi:hypothetical protein